MRHDRFDRRRTGEPCFEPPPRLADGERRLAKRAAAAFEEGDAHPFRDNALRLICGADGQVAAAAIGATVAAAFDLAPGPLGGGAETLAGVLLAAFDRCAASAAVTPFEAAVATPAAACVLVRGVLLPTAAGVEAVLSWKQVLDPDATALLRAELLHELKEHPPARAARCFD